ncbi:carbohydrate ABC transporter permease [Cohnella yongneupensis]|uniref:Carbohydrate ABC transporter permease n=1 Tax=Cohnella yongneupensis TaxID=425006 RepID=A0ABW0R1M9_9BACL
MNITYKTQKNIILVAFLILPLTILLSFSYYPAIDLFYMSMTSWDGLSATKAWIGFDNYRELFSDPRLIGVFKHNFAYLIAGVVQNIAALYFAVLLSSRMKGRNLFKVIIFLPFIMNGVAVSYMFGYLYDSQSGGLNMLFDFIGLGHSVNWLGDRSIVNYSLAFINIWKYTGFSMVIYLGSLQAIPVGLYEAAKIDGATRLQAFRYITLPSIRSIIEVSMFLTVTGSMEVFELPFILTKGGPIGSSETFVTKTVDVAFTYSNFGLASAMAVVLLLLIGTILIVQRKLIMWGEK